MSKPRQVLQIKIGGSGVASGLLPVQSLDLFRGVLDLIRAEAEAPIDWRARQAHISLLGASSTLAAVVMPEEMIDPSVGRSVRSFVDRAKRHDFGPAGNTFLTSAIEKKRPWSYVEVRQPSKTGSKALRLVRLDQKYVNTQELKLRSTTIEAEEEVYAKVLRCGGTDRRTARLELLSGHRGSYPVQGEALAKKLGARLYDLVKLRARVRWDRGTSQMRTMTIIDVDEQWSYRDLADIVSQSGKLNVELRVNSVADLMVERRATN